MKSEINVTNRQQELDKLCREPIDRMKETPALYSPGAAMTAYAARIQENYSYNVYNVIKTVIGEPGSEPVSFGDEIQAVNLAEPFGQQGTLTSDTYVIVFRFGNKYIIYAKP
jgi:hypothetical protein